MNKEIQWLVYLGLERGLFDLPSCRSIAEDSDPDCDIVSYAEALLSSRACTDFDAMQDLVEEAYNKALQSDPPKNPFKPAKERHEAPDEAERQKDTNAPGDLPSIESINHLDDREKASTYMKDLLRISDEMGASDLHLSANARPFVRLNREVRYLYETDLSENGSEQLNVALLSEKLENDFRERQDLDFALTLGEKQRYRANLFVHKGGIAGTYRIVPAEVPNLEKLGFGDLAQIRKLLSYHNGLILVTGPVGSGKTVTLAAMMDELNRTRTDHVIAVEEPIEIVQHSKKCHMTQREVGRHTSSFSSALKGALRQDPDIIVIGEMRDLETIEMAISASETGHLVIGTLHTSDAANTLNRVLDVFPASQQTQIRVMLSHALRGIICQNLIPSTDGGMALAYELLLCNTAVRNLIRDNKPEGLVNVMETGASEGMQLLDKSIFTLWEEGKVTDSGALKGLRSKMKRKQLTDLMEAKNRPTESENASTR